MFRESSSTIIHMDSSLWSYVVTIPNINSFTNIHNHGREKGMFSVDFAFLERSFVV